MMTLMRFRRDVQVPGRYFPVGTVLHVMMCEDSAIIPPLLDIGAPLVRVPADALEAVCVFSATVINAKYGVEGECEIVGADEGDARYRFCESAPECEILHLERLEG